MSIWSQLIIDLILKGGSNLNVVVANFRLPFEEVILLVCQI